MQKGIKKTILHINKIEMPSFRVMCKNVFVTITNIVGNFNSKDGDDAINDLFGDELSTLPYFAWESSDKSNDHVHILFNFAKSQSVTRKTFAPLCELFGT
jgi:hypothetical protein